MDSLSEFISALSGIAWPGIVSVLLWKLFPKIEKIIESRQFIVKYGKFELSTQKVSEQISKQINDLQQLYLKLIADETFNAGDKKLAIHNPSLSTSDTISSIKNIKNILWVDDNPENNAYEITALEQNAFNVVQVKSTIEATNILNDKTKKVGAIVTDLGRIESKMYVEDAGIQLIKNVRNISPDIPIFVYTTEQKASDNLKRIVTAGGNGATGSPLTLLSYFINQ